MCCFNGRLPAHWTPQPTVLLLFVDCCSNFDLTQMLLLQLLAPLLTTVVTLDFFLVHGVAYEYIDQQYKKYCCYGYCYVDFVVLEDNTPSTPGGDSHTVLLYHDTRCIYA